MQSRGSCYNIHIIAMKKMYMYIFIHILYILIHNYFYHIYVPWFLSPHWTSSSSQLITFLISYFVIHLSTHCNEKWVEKKMAVCQDVFINLQVLILFFISIDFLLHVYECLVGLNKCILLWPACWILWDKG